MTLFRPSGQPVDCGADSIHASEGKFRPHSHNNIAGNRKYLPMQTEGLAEEPFDPVAAHCAAGFARHTDAQTAVRQRIGKKDERKTGPAQPPALLIDQIVFSGFSEQTGFGQGEPLHAVQAESRFRPLARRRRITAWPERVFMRARKPWVRARLILLG